jgi:hypothetical protein
MLRKPGPHRIRIEKVGTSLSFRIDVDNDGESVDDLEVTVPDITEFATSLHEKSSYLYINGGAVFGGVRVGPSTSRVVAVVGAAPNELMPLSRGNPWPSFLQAGDNAFFVKDGLEVRGNTYVTTKRADYIDRDFTFEIGFVFPAWTERSVNDQGAHVGIGEPSGGNSPEVGVFLTARPPDVNDGNLTLESCGGKGTRRTEKHVTNLRSRGPHLLRIEKVADAVTFTVDVDADGKSDDDAELTIPDVTEYAPYLHKKNSQLIFGGGARFTKIRLSTAN